jgi:hypothetical protein
MRALSLALCLSLQAASADEHLDALRKAVDKTGSAAYSYQVKGRFERAGEFVPEALLTSRIKLYQSARHGEKILVKGPEGLWKTPEERIGEKVEKPDPDAAAMVRTLQEAEAPHRMAAELLKSVARGRAPEDRELDGIPCRRYQLGFTAESVRASLEKQIEKALKAGTLERPDEIQWGTAKGSLRIYVHRLDGRLVKLIDERLVRMAYKRDESTQIKIYKTDMELDFRDWGRAQAALPPEVKEKLGIKEE